MSIIFINEFHIRSIMYTFWLLICCINLYWIAYKICFKMNFLDYLCLKELWSQTIFINHSNIMKINYNFEKEEKEEQEIDGFAMNYRFDYKLIRKNRNQSTSIHLLISYLDTNNFLSVNNKLYVIIMNMTKIFAFLFSFVFVIIPCFLS